ncbi:hypothetical protein [Streptomyces sp. S.PB5]|nr:hypothetical protein [Streptomyces sp. S.PB5]MDN3025976.1 hypothetical protein [Streptomyces sp. S.PB5]
MTQKNIDVQNTPQPAAAKSEPTERKSISSRINKYGKYDRLQ